MPWIVSSTDLRPDWETCAAFCALPETYFAFWPDAIRERPLLVGVRPVALCDQGFDARHVDVAGRRGEEPGFRILREDSEFVPPAQQLAFQFRQHGVVRCDVRLPHEFHFILMVRKFEIAASPVDIYRRTQMPLDHRRAFDVSARPAPAPGAVRSGQITGRRLPHHEVRRIALEGRHFDSSASDHLVPRASRQGAVLRERRNVKENVPLRAIARAAQALLVKRIGARAGPSRNCNQSDGQT